MAKRCELTGKAVLVGNKVSHSKIKTKKRFLPNIQSASLFSTALKENITLRLPASVIRSVNFKGGLDEFLLSSSYNDLTEKGRKIKKRILKVSEAKAS